MKFSVNSNDLLAGLLIVQKAIPVKSSDPIMENYLLALRGNSLQLTASNGEITLSTIVETTDTLNDGTMAIPSRQVTELLKELPDQPLDIEAVSDSAFRISWIGGESILPFLSGEDYPSSKKISENALFLETDTDTLGDGIGYTIYASCDEEGRAIMNSVYMDVKPDLTTFVASDLQKLVCYNTLNVKSSQECGVVINKRHAQVLRSILPKENTPLTIAFDKDIIIFTFGPTVAICSQTIGKYPDYKTIIPKNNSNILRIGRTRLLNTVKRIAVCSPKASNNIKFDLAPGSIEISSQDQGFEISAHEKVQCDYEGDELSVGFKSTHFSDILSNLTCENVMLKFADRRRSVLVIPDDEEGSDNIFGIVMPVVVR